VCAWIPTSTTGYDISPHYDSMIGKIIVKATTAQDAISPHVRALGEFMIEGPHTTVPLGQACWPMPGSSGRIHDHLPGSLH
jgi:biotin carboxylase